MKLRLLPIAGLACLVCVVVQAQSKFNYQLPGNLVRELVPMDAESKVFYDEIDDKENFHRVVDNIYKDTNGKYYVRSVRVAPIGKDSTAWLEYFRDIGNFIDFKTYWLLGRDFFANNGKVYYWLPTSDGDFYHELKGADPDTFLPFEEVSGGFDKQFVFYGSPSDDFEIIEGADPKTISVLKIGGSCSNCGDCYFVDKKTVFFGLHRVEGADPRTFELVAENHADAKDKTGKYLKGKRVK